MLLCGSQTIALRKEHNSETKLFIRSEASSRGYAPRSISLSQGSTPEEEITAALVGRHAKLCPLRGDLQKSPQECTWQAAAKGLLWACS